MNIQPKRLMLDTSSSLASPRDVATAAATNPFDDQHSEKDDVAALVVASISSRSPSNDVSSGHANKISTPPQSRTKNPFEKEEEEEPAGQEQKKKGQDSSQYEDDVDHLILNCRSDVEARLLLRGMTVDLLDEVDDLRTRLQENQAIVSNLTKERNDIIVFENNNEKEDNHNSTKLIKLIDALEGVTGDGGTGNSSSSEQVKAKMQEGKELTSDEATELVVYTLTNKVSALNIENTQLLDQIKEQQEKIDDLTSQNETYGYKIEALETQFKSINKTRQKAVAKLTDSSSSNDQRFNVNNIKSNINTSSPSSAPTTSSSSCISSRNKSRRASSSSSSTTGTTTRKHNLVSV